MSNANTEKLKHDLAADLALLKTVRDEVRVKLHLAGMDAKDAFRRLEAEADRVTREASAEVRTLVERLRAL